MIVVVVVWSICRWNIHTCIQTRICTYTIRWILNAGDLPEEVERQNIREARRMQDYEKRLGVEEEETSKKKLKNELKPGELESLDQKKVDHNLLCTFVIYIKGVSMRERNGVARG